MPNLNVPLEPEEYELLARARRLLAAKSNTDLSWSEFFLQLAATVRDA